MITLLHARRRGATLTLPVALAACASLFSPSPATAATPRTTRAAGQTITLPVRDALAQLPLAVEDRTGYQRTAFHH